MGKKEDDFLARLLVTFRAEADDHIRAITAGLLEMERAQSPQDMVPVIETIFREAHSLKGAARSVDLAEVEEICQTIESIFSLLKKKGLSVTPQLFDTLHHAMDMVETILANPGATDPSAISAVGQRLRHLAQGKKATEPMSGARRTMPESAPAQRMPAPQSPAPAGSPPPAGKSPVKQDLPQRPQQADTIRISAAKLDSLMIQAEEMVSVKMSAYQRMNELQEILMFVGKCGKGMERGFEEIRTRLYTRENGRKPDMPDEHLLPRVNEVFGLNHTRVKDLEARMRTLLKASRQEYSLLGGMVDTLIDDMKKAVMLPFSSLLESFPRMVRDLSREQRKEVELLIEGGEVEIDKRILEEIKDPLVHLVRNCVDHGLEPPEERSAAGKPRKGTVRIAVTREESNKIELLVSDDGAGVDPGKVKQAAVRQGVVAEEEADALGEQEALSLIFRAEVSTSPIITSISGRGLGLAIVREKVERTGGEVSVVSVPRQGVTFRLLLPLTMATSRVIIVKEAGRLFALPTVNVARVTRIAKDTVKTVENRETISLDGRAYSLARLGAVLGLPLKGDREDALYFPVLLVNSGGSSLAFAVEEIVNEQEILLKSLGRQLSRVTNFAGATVLGSGRIVPVLNAADLLKSATRSTGAPAAAGVSGKEPARRRSILIAEDSITARTLFKNILESAGYRVRATVDGVDALTALKTEEFDLVVSDVQMPRMSGFELTVKIRGDKALAHLPVVLVTGLESREDRERGIDVGANAYIVKSSFDQSNLLEVVRRLV